MGYIHDIVRSTGEEKATLKEVSESNINKWGDADESVSETEVTAVFELISGTAEEVTEGDFESGDLRAYIPSSYDNIQEGNVLVYQDKEYRIDEVLKMEIGHDSHYEVRAARV